MNACAYCGKPAKISGCVPCLRQGIDIPALTRGTRRLKPGEKLLAREIAIDEAFDERELRLLMIYVAGPDICSRYDALPEIVQGAVKRFKREMTEARG